MQGVVNNVERYGGFTVKSSINRQVILIAIVTLLFLSACGIQIDTPFQDSSEPIATVDTNEIVRTVLDEVEGRLTAQSVQLEANVAAEVQDQVGELGLTANNEVDTGTIVDSVLGELQAQLAQEPPASPVLVGNDSAVASMESALESLYQQANPSVVYIINAPLGSGTGFVFDQDGYIVTNNHVVDGGREYEVVFSNGERHSASLVGTDVDSDLAVIKVGHLPDSVKPLPVATEQPKVGQLVVAIGNPFGEQGSMSLGIISGLNRSLSSGRDLGTNLAYSLPEVIQTDAPINPGNSGGPLLNFRGEVVGINSAIRSTTGTNSGVGFSVPARAVARIVPSLIAYGEFEYSYMGVTFDGEISLEDQSTYGLTQTQGAYVLGVSDNGPADMAGLIPANNNTGRGGDLVIAIDGQPINDFSDLNSYLVYDSSAGQTIELTVLRDGEPVNLDLTLGSRP